MWEAETYERLLSPTECPVCGTRMEVGDLVVHREGCFFRCMRCAWRLTHEIEQARKRIARRPKRRHPK